jgi:hypothetical protein
MRVQFGGVPALPTSFIIDAQGRVVQKHIGLRDPDLSCRRCTTPNILCTALVAAVVKSPKSKVSALK